MADVVSKPGTDVAGDAQQSPELSDEEFQRLKDRILIVVGSGVAIEKLAQRRLGSHGRLCIVETDDASRVVTESAPPAAKAPPDLWSPPQYTAGSAKSAFAARFKASPPLHFVKKGPDAVKLQPDETLLVISFGGRLVGARAVGDGGGTRWEMSGAVILNPSSTDAEAIDVEVQDPEAVTMAYLDIKDVIFSLVINFVGFTIALWASSVGEEAATSGQVPWWRMAFWTIFTLTTGPLITKAAAMMYSGVYQPTGISMGIYLGAVFAVTLVASYAATLNGWSDFLVSVVWCVPQVAGAKVVFFATRKQFPKRSLIRQWTWGTLDCNFSLGIYILYYCSALAYLALLAYGQVFLASLFLPVMTSMIEGGVVYVMVVVYNAVVVKPRSKKPGCVHGEHRTQLAVTMAQAHGWAEATRAASVIASCATQPDDYAWVATLVMCTIINVLTRLGWASYWLSMISARLGSGASMGTTMLKLHNEMKLTCGYFRHVTLLCIVLSRLFALMETDPAQPAFAVFNGTALLAMLFMIIQEAVEDVLVHSALFPEPSVKKVHERWYTGLCNYSLQQLFMTVRKDDHGRKDEDDADDPVRVIARDAVRGKPCSTINLHGMHPCSFDCTLGAVGTVMLISKNLFELLLGVGYLRGVCDYPVSNIKSGIMESLLVKTPYGCP